MTPRIIVGVVALVGDSVRDMRVAIVSLFRKKKLSKLEFYLIKNLQQALSPESAAILQGQLDEIDHARRFAGSREVLYYSKKGKPRSSRAFPANRAELKFAKILFSVNGHSGTWRAEFHLVKGYFFSITFTPSPKEIQDATNIQIKKIDVLHDPVIAAGQPPALNATPRDVVKLPMWLEELEHKFEIRDLFEPLSSNSKAELLEAINATPPKEYLELIEVTEGLAVGDVAILGLSQVYETVMSDWNYFLVAEVASIGVLAVKEHGDDGEIFFLEYEGNPPWNRMGNRLSRAVNDLLIARRTGHLPRVG
jgi:hypothetical protein